VESEIGNGNQFHYVSYIPWIIDHFAIKGNPTKNNNVVLHDYSFQFLILDHLEYFKCGPCAKCTKRAHDMMSSLKTLESNISSKETSFLKTSTVYSTL
jgi:hypothetical protein